MVAGDRDLRHPSSASPARAGARGRRAVRQASAPFLQLPGDGPERLERHQQVGDVEVVGVPLEPPAQRVRRLDARASPRRRPATGAPRRGGRARGRERPRRGLGGLPDDRERVLRAHGEHEVHADSEDGRRERAGDVPGDVRAAFGRRRDRVRVGAGTLPAHRARRSHLRRPVAESFEERRTEQPLGDRRPAHVAGARRAPLPWGRVYSPLPEPWPAPRRCRPRSRSPRNAREGHRARGPDRRRQLRRAASSHR